MRATLPDRWVHGARVRVARSHPTACIRSRSSSTTGTSPRYRAGSRARRVRPTRGPHRHPLSACLLHAGANRNETDTLPGAIGPQLRRRLLRWRALCFALLVECFRVLFWGWFVEVLGAVRIASFCASLREPLFARMVVVRF